MNRLYLLRHGIAVARGTEGYPDDERPLTSQGERRMREIGRGLKRFGLKLDRIVTSPLPRAFRTAELVADALDVPELLEASDALRAEKDAPSIRAWLDTRDESRLMIVGHDPSFTDLARLLATGQGGPPICVLRKGGIAAFVAQADGGMRLDWLARPRVYRRLVR